MRGRLRRRQRRGDEKIARKGWIGWGEIRRYERAAVSI